MRIGFTGRVWRPTVRTQSEELQARQSQTNEAEGNREMEYERQMMEALTRCPEGETYNVLRESVRFPKARVRVVINALVDRGVVVAAVVRKRAGRGFVDHDGYRLARLPNQMPGVIRSDDDAEPEEPEDDEPEDEPQDDE